MLESTADMPAPPRSPRSPRSPWSAREVELELDDAFSLTERESETFSASSLPTRADLQRMAAWREHGADEDEEDVASQSPMTFRRSLSPSPSPTRLASIPQDDIVELDVAMDAVDLQDKLNGSLALQLDEAESMAVDEPQPETLPVPLPAADEHPYPTVHIDVAHRTVRSISSISGLTEGSQHSHNGSLADSNRATSPPPFASTSQQLQTPSSATSSSFPSAISGPSSSPSSARPQRAGTSHGPSALEKVLSKTRPMHLPPKNKEEDNKHLKDWEDMMYKSRAADEKRAALVADRRRARELAVQASIPVWEREILPDWRIASEDKRLRTLWWNGIPSNLRGLLWERAIGNDIALSRDSFARCSARGRRARESGVSPLGPSTMISMEEDISSTLPSLHLFKSPTGPMYDDLRDMLCAFMIARADEGVTHYVSGTARAAAMLLLNLPPDRAFIALRNLLERHCLRSFYGGEALKEDVDAYYRIFDTLLADCMPKVYFNFKQHQISPAVYLADWLVPLFVDHLPVEACARVWDGIVLHGDSFLFRVALALLSNIEMRLFFPERKELLEVLRGENRAAQEVARRTGALRPETEGAGKYAHYGVDEESVWARIIEMDDWWKESTWKRLLQRELPDL